MKREALKALGLTDEQINAVMTENGKDVQAEIAKTQAAETERDSLKTQLGDRDKDIAELKKGAGDNADLAKKYADLEAKYQADTERLTKEMQDREMQIGIEEVIRQAKARDVRAVMPFIDREKCVKKGDGTYDVPGLAELQKEKPYLFEVETKKDVGGNPAGGTSASGGGGTAISQETFIQNLNNPDWINQHWDAVSQGLANGTLTKG